MTPLAISAFLQSSLVIAANGIARLDGCQSIWDESSDEQFLLQDRLVTETLLLALLVNRTSLSPVTSEALQAICLYCAPKIYTRRNLALLDQNPEAAIPLGIGHLALAEMNYGNEEFGDAIRQAFLSGRIFSGVRSPFRAIEARWLESLLFPDRRPAFDDLLPGSLLQAEVHPLLMSPADNHAFTHALMYVTDFGRNPLPGQLSADRLAGMIDITLSGALVEERLDLAGELIMSAIFLRHPLSERVFYAWHFMISTWGEFGFLPCSTFDSEHYAAQESSEARMAYAFKHTYRTNHVGAMLCSLLLNDPSLLDSRTAGSASDKLGSSFLPILKLLNDCPGLKRPSPCQWIKTISNAPIGGPALRQLLTDGLAVHAAHCDDFVTLCNLLDDCRAGVVPSTATLSEAARFLEQRTDSGAFPAEVQARISSTLRSWKQ